MSVRPTPGGSPPQPLYEHDVSRRLFRPYASPNHNVTKGRYITSNDPRGYIPVYEYPLLGQWIMMDMDDGYILWTGIWKALGHSKADIVKMVESEPELAARIRRVRGGYLKIQGTWMPYEVALRLSRRVAWHIRYDLVPLFGPTFPDTCIAPDQPGFGQIVSGDARKRRNRRVAGPGNASNHSWSIVSPIDQSPPPQGHLPSLQQRFYVGNSQGTTPLFSTPQEHGPPRSPNPSTPTSHLDTPRYGPYQSSYLSQRPEIHVNHLSDQSRPRRPASTSPIIREGQRVTLPPVQPSSSNYAVSLPSVADLVRFNAIGDRDPPKTILERLKHGDSSVHHSPTTSRPPNETFVSSRPSPQFPLFSASLSHGDVSPSAPAHVGHDQRVYVTEVPQIHDLDHSSGFRSETRGEMSGGGLPRKDESDFSRTVDSDVHSSNTPVRRPLRPW